MEDGDKLIRVKAVRKGWYGLEPHLHKLYEPEKMKDDELTFMCRVKDFSDSTKPIIPKEYIGKNFPFKSRTGWMKRLDDPAPVSPKAVEPVAVAAPAPAPAPVAVAPQAEPAKRGPGRPPKARASDQA